MVELKYFKTDELTCQHCGAVGINPTFIKKIDDLRDLLGFPFKISSAYRCPQHPIEMKKNSVGAHQRGRAIDIRVHGERAIKLIEAGIAAGMQGIGVSQKGSVSTRFIHLDDLTNEEKSPRPWIWSY